MILLFPKWSWHVSGQTYTPGNNLTGIAVQFATQDQKNATQVQKCIAIFKKNSSKLEFIMVIAMQNFESKLFPDSQLPNEH